MESIQVENYICSETAVPKRHIVRSDGALYVALLALVMGIILCGNAVSARWDLPRFYVQLVLYAILIGIGYLVYRFCLVSFQYTLTTRMLTVNRVVGKKVRPEANVHLSDIVSVRPFAEAGEMKRPRSVFTGRKRDSLAVTVAAGGQRYTLLLSPTDGFLEKLKAQWKIERK